MGELGWPHYIAYKVTVNEALLAIKYHHKKEDALFKDRWTQTRRICYHIVAAWGGSKKYKSDKDLWRFPWEKIVIPDRPGRKLTDKEALNLLQNWGKKEEIVKEIQLGADAIGETNTN